MASVAHSEASQGVASSAGGGDDRHEDVAGNVDVLAVGGDVVGTCEN